MKPTQDFILWKGVDVVPHTESIVNLPKPGEAGVGKTSRLLAYFNQKENETREDYLNRLATLSATYVDKMTDDDILPHNADIMNKNKTFKSLLKYDCVDDNE